MAQVSVSNVRKSYGVVEVLRGIDVEVEDQEFVALVGPSGCGKSTLLRMIAGLEPISRGEISIGGRVVNDVPPKKRDVAMVFQNYALYPHMTVAKNMGFSLKLAGKPATEIEQRVARAADILDLRHLLDRLPKQLSGGQRQRVAMGRAIVRDPQVFLFDEPLSNLDAKLRVQMRAEIKALHQRLKTTTVYVTHDQIEAMTMADKIVVMRDGNVEQIGSPLELYDRPGNIFVAGFIGSPAMNFIEGKVEAGRFIAAGGIEADASTISVAGDGKAVILGVRPEHLAVADQGITATTVVSEQTGSETHILVTLGAATWNVLVKDRLQVRPDETIHLVPSAGHLHFFDAATGIRLATQDEGNPGAGSSGPIRSPSAQPANASSSNSKTKATKRIAQALERMGLQNDGYRPELYYMRGPGPRTLAKSARGAGEPASL